MPSHYGHGANKIQGVPVCCGFFQPKKKMPKKDLQKFRHADPKVYYININEGAPVCLVVCGIQKASKEGSKKVQNW